MTASTSESQFHSSGIDSAIDVRWVMPEGFFEIPLDADSIDELADRMVTLGREILPGADSEIQVQLALMFAANLDTFAEAGVQYAGFVVTEVDGVRCTATVNVSLMDLDDSIAGKPVHAIAAAMRGLEMGEVAEIKLPCGPAVSCVGTRQTTVDGSLTPSGAAEPVWTSFIQVQVPLTNATVLVLELGTPTPEGWDVFSSMFAGVVKSLRLFDSDGTLLVMPR
ncbi:hypothetical protein [Streptomyces sp. NPDC088725]|uniref:hypothetical protein n=1 Tax=Streptomyces sp. NPDC088725 TaxID=3365873 RepID=UPI0038142D62